MCPEAVDHWHPTTGEYVARYRRGRLLGKGGFAMVYEFTDAASGACWAAKVVAKSTFENKMTKRKLESEICVHAAMRHPHIVRFKCHFEDAANVYLLMEMCSGQTIADRLKARGPISSAEAALWLRQIASALSYMHKQRVIHRDLKLANLFLDREGNVKVGDFGLACQLRSPDELRRTVCGTPNYIAPEVLRGKRGGHSYAADLWSLGAVLYTMLVGRPPFETKSVEDTYARIKKNDFEFPARRPVCPLAKDLITRLLRVEPGTRLSLDRIKSHDFIGKYYTHARRAAAAPSAAAPPQAEKPREALPAAPRVLNTKRVGAGAPEGFYRIGAEGGGFPDAVKPPREDSAAGPRAAGGQPGHPHSLRDSAASQQSRRYGLGTSSSSLQSSAAQAASRGPASPAEAGAETDSRPTTTGRGSLLHSALNSRPAATEQRSIQQSPSIYKWYDYSAKYGICFRLTDGSTGFLFNDETKMTLCARKEHISYFCGSKAHPSPDFPFQLLGSSGTLAFSMGASETPPASLKKKVALLLHFNDQLRSGAAVAAGGGTPCRQAGCGGAGDALYVKRWVKTQHASIFRFSNRTIQVCFKDRSYIHLCTREKYVTYMDKHGSRALIMLAALPKDPPLLRRLKYTKEVLFNLLNGNKVPEYGS